MHSTKQAANERSKSILIGHRASRQNPLHHFATVVSASYRHQALALAESLRLHNPDSLLHVLVVDSFAFPDPPPPDGVRWLSLDALAGVIPPAMPLYFDAFELCNALKPFLVRNLLSEGAERVIYLDCDILVAGSFSPAWSRLASCSLLLTPHLTKPPGENVRDDDELGLADLGVYNGGFSAWRDTPPARAMLDWLCDRLPRLGFCDPARRMFVDQKLLVLLPLYFPGEVGVDRDPALNIAYWNAHEREVRSEGGRWLVAGEPVIFFHMSGFRLERPDVPCAYQTAETNSRRLAVSPWLAPLLAEYAALVRRHLPAGAPGYGFSRHDGVRLTPRLRRLLYPSGDFDRGSASFWRAWCGDRSREVKRRLLPRR